MKTEVVHSQSKNAWNVIGKVLGGKYKIARVPYNVLTGMDMDKVNTLNRYEALKHAEFISDCFNRLYNEGGDK